MFMYQDFFSMDRKSQATRQEVLGDQEFSLTIKQALPTYQQELQLRETP